MMQVAKLLRGGGFTSEWPSERLARHANVVLGSFCGGGFQSYAEIYWMCKADRMTDRRQAITGHF